MNENLLLKAGDVLAAYVSRNELPQDQVPVLLNTIYQQLLLLSEQGSPISKPEPAVPVAESVTKDHIICLEDGKPVVLLKRYLARHHNMTPEEYIEKWNLPADYPLVAESYSKKRSDIAKEHGLGTS